MTARLLEMKRILKPTGAIYLHCDPTMSHYLKLVMDAVFGKENFKREVIWNIAVLSGFKTKAKNYVRGHDTILFYVKSKEYTWNSPRQAHRQEYLDRFNKTDEKGRRYFDGRGKRRYLDEAIAAGKAVGDVWSDVMSFQQMPTSKERVGYPTQKPLALLERIIKASSNKDEVVFDPFCGCATTLVAADRLQREWIGIDISEKAAELVVERIKTDQGLFENIINRTDIPKRTDLGDIPRYNHPKNKTQLYGEQSGDCNGCGTHFQKQHLEVDHIIAENVGGTDHIENLQLLCGNCNRIKGDRGHEYLISRLNKD